MLNEFFNDLFYWVITTPIAGLIVIGLNIVFIIAIIKASVYMIQAIIEYYQWRK
jgi:hypothetical protein